MVNILIVRDKKLYIKFSTQIKKWYSNDYHITSKLSFYKLKEYMN